MAADDPILQALERSGLAYEIMACDPAFSDTAQFCAHYGHSLDFSANTILVKSKTGEEKFAMCVLLATARLDVNKTIRKRLGARKASFATPDETKAITGMQLGGVTPFNLPAELALWIDAEVMARTEIILGGGARNRKIKISPRVFLGLPNVEVVDGLARAIPSIDC